ncbi:MAG: AI-2E family transporter [Anaerocolumna sp.]
MKWKDYFNPKYTIIAIYVVITAVVIYCLSLVARNSPVIIQKIMDSLGWFMHVCKPIIIGFVFAYLLDPVNEFFEKQYSKIRIKKWQLKSTRTLAVITTILLFFIFISVIISLMIFSITDQLRLANFKDIGIIIESYSKTINDFYKSILNMLDNLNIESSTITDYVKAATTFLMNGLKDIGMSTVYSVTNITSSITTMLFSLVISIYFMIDGKMIKVFISKVGNALLNEKWNKKTARFLQDADSVFSGYIRGQLSDALIMAILISIMLSVIGVKFALVIGVLAGIGNLIPYLGPIVAYFTTTLACLVNGQYKELLIAIIALLIVQAIDGNIIAPKLLGHSIQIHPVLVIISLIFGSAIGGLLGMLLAVPVGALIKLLFVRYIDTRLENKEKLTD